MLKNKTVLPEIQRFRAQDLGFGARFWIQGFVFFFFGFVLRVLDLVLRIFWCFRYGCYL